MKKSSFNYVIALSFVLSLGLVSCASDKSKSIGAFRTEEPKLQSKEGLTSFTNIKGLERPQKITDALVFGPSLSLGGAKLKIKAQCSGTQNKQSIRESVWPEPQQLQFYQFLPIEVLTDFDSLEVAQICSFEFVAQNAQGAKHYFHLPAIKLTSFDEFTGWNTFSDGHKSLGAKPPPMSSDTFSSLWAAPEAIVSHYELHCDHFQVARQAVPRARFSFAEVPWPSQEATLKSRPITTCRFFGYAGSGLVALSQTLRLSLRPTVLKPEIQILTGPLQNSFSPLDLIVARITNPYDTPVILKADRISFAMRPLLLMYQSFVQHFSIATAPQSQIILEPTNPQKGALVQKAAGQFSVSLPPKAEVSLVLRLPHFYTCPSVSAGGVSAMTISLSHLGVYLNFEDDERPYLRVFHETTAKDLIELSQLQLTPSNKVWRSLVPNIAPPPIKGRAPGHGLQSDYHCAIHSRR